MSWAGAEGLFSLSGDYQGEGDTTLLPPHKGTAFSVLLLLSRGIYFFYSPSSQAAGAALGIRNTAISETQTGLSRGLQSGGESMTMKSYCMIHRARVNTLGTTTSKLSLQT